MPIKDPEKRKEYNKEYNQSEKGKEKRRKYYEKYNGSDKQKAAKKKYTDSHPEMAYKDSRNRTLRMYDKNTEWFYETLEIQNGVCATCFKEETAKGRSKLGKIPVVRPLSIDHDHRTGIVRGLLCNNCNRALGNVNDNIEVLQSLIAYLQKHQSGL